MKDSEHEGITSNILVKWAKEHVISTVIVSAVLHLNLIYQFISVSHI